MTQSRAERIKEYETRQELDDKAGVPPVNRHYDLLVRLDEIKANTEIAANMAHDACVHARNCDKALALIDHDILILTGHNILGVKLKMKALFWFSALSNIFIFLIFLLIFIAFTKS